MGPKIDFVVRDCIGREWQLGTVQLDYNLPKRFDLEYTGPDNRPHRPVMIHRAPFGSMERFVGILIEHFAGAFPLWLAPEQARIIPISEKYVDYARKVEQALRERGFRVTTDVRPEKMQAKIREAQLEKIPYMLVVGEKEQAAGPRPSETASPATLVQSRLTISWPCWPAKSKRSAFERSAPPAQALGTMPLVLANSQKSISPRRFFLSGSGRPAVICTLQSGSASDYDN